MKGPWSVEAAETWPDASEDFAADPLATRVEAEFVPFSNDPGRKGSEPEHEWEQTQDPSGTHSEASWMEAWETSNEGEIEFVAPTDPKLVDATEPGTTWPRPNKPRAPRADAEFVVEGQTIPSAEVLELHLLDFAVDRHELRAPHRAALAALAKRVAEALRSGRYSEDKCRAYAYGETSSTGGDLHNLKLSRHRAYNTLKGLNDALKAEGVAERVMLGYYGTGEQRAKLKTGDGKEVGEYRGALLRLICPLAAAKPCPKCEDCPPEKDCPPPKDTRGGDSGGDRSRPPSTTTLCFSVPSIPAPPKGSLVPARVPLNSFLPALKLPVALLLDGRARMKVTAGAGAAHYFDFKGWGLELALPTGRHSATLRADLRVAIALVGKQAGGLIGKVVAGPLAAMVGIDVAAVGRMIASLAVHLEGRLDVDFKSPGLTEPTGCRAILAALPRGESPDLRALSGTAFLIVPGRGFGPATLMLKGNQLSKLRLGSDTFTLPADKANVRTLLALGGQLKPAQATTLETETSHLPAEWPESLLEVAAGLD